MRVYVQGHAIELSLTGEVRPTVFSLFLANGIRVSEDDRLACDLGCGGGVLAVTLALLGVEKVVAIDCSEAACALAVENADRNGVGDRVEVIHGELSELGPDRGFDLVVSNPPTMPDGPQTPGFAAGSAAGRSFVSLLTEGLASWLGSPGRAQVALSSLAAADVLEGLAAVGFVARPLATLLAPFRNFYAAAYDSGEIDRFVADGLAVANGESADSGLSEFITVYELTAAAARG
jgi:tRNA1(Val) A37 N6-methylase TrmN6